MLRCLVLGAVSTVARTRLRSAVLRTHGPLAFLRSSGAANLRRLSKRSVTLRQPASAAWVATHSRCRTAASNEVARSVGGSRKLSSVAAVAAAGGTGGKTPLSTILWRCAWVPYAVLSLIPHAFLLTTLYQLARGDRAKARGWAFYTVTGYICLPLSIVVNFSLPFVYLFDWDRRVLYNYITKLWGKMTTWAFVVPTIRGAENIPGTAAAAKAAPDGSTLASRLGDRPVVFVSNHQSWLDIFCMCWLPDDVILRFISKIEIAYIPVVGWSMALLGHVLFDRRTGGKQLLDDCSLLLQKRVPVFFFVEGTRSPDPTQLLPFKAGAFKLALDNGAVIVPVTVQGTSAIMGIGHETELQLEPAEGAGGGVRRPQVTITIHEPIVVGEGDTVESLRDRSEAAIRSALVVGGASAQ
jgi:1-acyl-sn-glycerol-3-phosphate acyltransferase